MEDFESNVEADRKRPRPTTAVNGEFEDLLLRWIRDANSRRISLTGALIQERARSFATQLDMTDFKGSNGWLDKFLKRHGLVSKTMSGERGDVNENCVNTWQDRLPTICDGYEPRDIFNMDETGIFFKQGRRTTFCPKDADCAGGKRAKNRITAALCASMAGEKIKPLVIGRAGKPRCFKRVDVNSLPVTYRHNKKAWMNGKLFEEWVKSFDKKMRRQNRKVLLFVDNASSHQDNDLTNVKLVKLPPNSTSVLQPMDQGIIQATKLKFYKQQSSHIIARMENSTLCGTDLLKEVNVLDTIYWLGKAWKDVEPSSIARCFDKCGFDKLRQTPVEAESEDEDEDDDIPLALLARSERIYGRSLMDVVNDEIQTDDAELTDWDRPVSELLAKDSESDSDSDTDDTLCETPDIVPVSMTEARECVEKLKVFAASRGCGRLLANVMDMSSSMTEISIRNMTVQRKISSFFK